MCQNPREATSTLLCGAKPEHKTLKSAPPVVTATDSRVIACVIPNSPAPTGRGAQEILETADTSM